MIIDLDQLKTLVEAGDKLALEQHIYKALEKGDVLTAATTNPLIKSELDSEKDKHHSTALETWKTNNLTKVVDEELAKRNPAKTPAEIALAELQKKFDDSEKATKKEKNMNTAIKQATAKGLPVDILDIFVNDNEEISTANYSRLEESFTKAVQAAVEGTFKKGGRSFNNEGGNKDPDAGAYGKKIADNAAGTNTGLEEARKSYFG